MPARLGDLALAKRLIDENPNCLSARTFCKGYDRVPAFGIYNWVLGFYVSPHDVAIHFGHREMHDYLMSRSSPMVRFLSAAMRNDQAATSAALKEDPTIRHRMTANDHSLLAYAALQNCVDAFRHMLNLGFDPMARGLDGGTVLHMAAWVGAEPK